MSKDRRFLPELDGVIAGVFERSKVNEAQVRVDQQQRIGEVCNDPDAVRAVAKAVMVSERSRRAGFTRS